MVTGDEPPHDPAPQNLADGGPSEPTCFCGHPLAHPEVTPTLRYGFWAWTALLMGITGYPKEATWRCRTCGAVLKRSRDPQVLKALSE